MALEGGVIDAIKDLVRAADALSAHDATNKICKSMDDLPDVLDRLQNSEARDKAHSDMRQNLLKEYNADRDRMKDENRSLITKHEELEKTMKELNERVMHEETVSAKHASEAKAWSAAVERIKAVGKDQERQIQGLIQARKTDKIEKEAQQSQLRSTQLIVQELRQELARVSLAHETLQKKANIDAASLQELRNLSGPLGQDYAIIKKLESTWTRLAHLVSVAFGSSIPLESTNIGQFWSELSAFSPWTKQLPLLKSNTDAAREMRCIVILATLARSFCEQIFQPTDLVPPNAGLRDMLWHQAQHEPKREAAFRALLHALLPAEQDKMLARKCVELCDTNVKWLAPLLLPTELGAFRKQLTDIIEEACEIWRQVKHLEDPVVPSFEVMIHTDRAVRRMKLDQNDLVTLDDTLSNVDDDVALAILPEFVALSEREQVSELSGVVFLQSQLQHAKLEAKETMREPRSPTQRSRPTRDRGASRTNGGPGPFLDTGDPH